MSLRHPVHAKWHTKKKKSCHFACQHAKWHKKNQVTHPSKWYKNFTLMGVWYDFPLKYLFTSVHVLSLMSIMSVFPDVCVCARVCACVCWQGHLWTLWHFRPMIIMIDMTHAHRTCTYTRTHTRTQTKSCSGSSLDSECSHQEGVCVCVRVWVCVCMCVCCVCVCVCVKHMRVYVEAR